MVLEDFAVIIGCCVRSAVPVSGHLGEYDAARHEIRVHPALAAIQCQAVLAHEIGHAAYRHESSTALTEREADEFSDWLRIPFCDFLRATQAHSTVQAVAHELDLLPADVRRYAQRIWE
ncbi:MAG: ImmA/IrrE family metallo-endopeptidase [Micrococcaceae bacterium]|nr:ImmA/IrrE family metallo-endopeptidase [Micrococcaceae bacterium]